MKQYAVHNVQDNQVLNPAWPENSRPVSWIQHLVIHHDAVNRPHNYDDIPRRENEAHYQNNVSIPGSKGLMYHYWISNEGDIFWARPHSMLLWHDGNFPSNQHSIAICLDGNLSEQGATQEQLEALKQLLDDLSVNHPEFPAAQGDVYPHRHFSATNCCGDNLVPFVDAYRTNGGNLAVPHVGYDHPELQPGYVDPITTPVVEIAPAPPQAPFVPPAPVVSATPVDPIQPTVPAEVNVIPILDVEKPEYQTTFVPFANGDRDMILTSDAEAVDFSNTKATLALKTGQSIKLAGTVIVANRVYYRGTTATPYGVPIEAFGSDGQAKGVPNLTIVQAAEAVGLEVITNVERIGVFARIARFLKSLFHI